MGRPAKKSAKIGSDQLVMTTIRMPADIKAALAEAAKDEGRSASNLLMHIARGWLVSQGYLTDGARAPIMRKN